VLEVPVPGFCVVSVEELDDGLALAPCDIDEDELMSVELPGDVLDVLLLGDVVLDELLLGDVVLDELLEGAVAEPFRFTSVELEELLGADAAPFRLMSVELDELPGVDEAPFRLIELDDELGTLPPLIVVEDEDDPGTTATPGVTSVVVVLLDWLSGTLGMQPAGCVFAVSMHFGSRRSLVTLVTVSARATPNAASMEAARRLILKVRGFICIASVLDQIWVWHRGPEPVACHGPCGRASNGGAKAAHAPCGPCVGRNLQMQRAGTDNTANDCCRISLSTP